MKIAILAWGSLITDPRNLQIKGHWNTDGPLLPIEFARVSRDGRLTLVLYPGADNVRTLWAHAAYEDLNQARENLRERECKYLKDIGYLSIPDNKSNCQAVPQVLESIRRWAEEKGLDAVIWTDLPSNFKKKTRMDFNEDNVIKYLRSLTAAKSENTEEYIRKASAQIETAIRRRIEKELGWERTKVHLANK
jgi:hypothetical protein